MNNEVNNNLNQQTNFSGNNQNLKQYKKFNTIGRAFGMFGISMLSYIILSLIEVFGRIVFNVETFGTLYGGLKIIITLGCLFVGIPIVIAKGIKINSQLGK